MSTAETEEGEQRVVVRPEGLAWQSSLFKCVAAGGPATATATASPPGT